MESINIFLSNIDRDNGTVSNFNVSFSKYGLNRDVKYYYLDIYEATTRATSINVNGVLITSDIVQLNTIDTSQQNIFLILPCVDNTNHIYTSSMVVKRCIIQNPLNRSINFKIIDAETRNEITAPVLHIHMKLTPYLDK
jgi:hypothetical protein